jgi:hypothetical protein
MTQKSSVRLKVSPEVARIVREESREVRLRAARGELDLDGENLLTTLAFLVHGSDEELRTEALQTLAKLPRASLAPVVANPQLHPQLLDLVARVRGDDSVLMEMLVANPSAEAATVARIALCATPHAETKSPDTDPAAEEEDDSPPSEEGPEDEEVDPSKYRQALQMVVAEKIKMALTGDKEWRSIFLKDTNKLVSSAALKNPRITDGEVLALAKNKSSSDELIRIITLNPEWVKNYEIQKALVLHPRTPLPKALRYMNVLTLKDLKHLAKSRGVSQVITNNARRLLLAKDKSR